MGSLRIPWPMGNGAGPRSKAKTAVEAAANFSIKAQARASAANPRHGGDRAPISKPPPNCVVVRTKNKAFEVLRGQES